MDWINRCLRGRLNTLCLDTINIYIPTDNRRLRGRLKTFCLDTISVQSAGSPVLGRHRHRDKEHSVRGQLLRGVTLLSLSRFTPVVSSVHHHSGQVQQERHGADTRFDTTRRVLIFIWPTHRYVT